MFVSSGIRALDLRAMATNDGASGAQGAKVTEISPYSHHPPATAELYRYQHHQPSPPPAPTIPVPQQQHHYHQGAWYSNSQGYYQSSPPAFAFGSSTYSAQPYPQPHTHFNESQTNSLIYGPPPPSTYSAQPYPQPHTHFNESQANSVIYGPPPLPSQTSYPSHQYSQNLDSGHATSFSPPQSNPYLPPQRSSSASQPQQQQGVGYSNLYHYRTPSPPQLQYPPPQSGPLPTPASYYAPPPQPNLYQPPQQQPQGVGNSHLFQYQTPSPPQLQDPPLFISVAVAEEAKLTSPECKRDEAVAPNGTTHGALERPRQPPSFPAVEDGSWEDLDKVVPSHSDGSCGLESTPASNTVSLLPVSVVVESLEPDAVEKHDSDVDGFILDEDYPCPVSNIPLQVTLHDELSQDEFALVSLCHSDKARRIVSEAAKCSFASTAIVDSHGLLDSDSWEDILSTRHLHDQMQVVLLDIAGEQVVDAPTDITRTLGKTLTLGSLIAFDKYGSSDSVSVDAIMIIANAMGENSNDGDESLSLMDKWQYNWVQDTGGGTQFLFGAPSITTIFPQPLIDRVFCRRSLGILSVGYRKLLLEFKFGLRPGGYFLQPASSISHKFQGVAAMKVTHNDRAPNQLPLPCYKCSMLVWNYNDKTFVNVSQVTQLQLIPELMELGKLLATLCISRTTQIIGDIGKAENAHTGIDISMDLEQDVEMGCVLSSLVDMYGHCGIDIEETVMISKGLGNSGQISSVADSSFSVEIVGLFACDGDPGSAECVLIYVTGSSATEVSQFGKIDFGQGFSSDDMHKSGFMLYRLGSMTNFATLHEVIVVNWNVSLLAACAKSGDVNSGHQLWNNIYVTSFSFSIVDQVVASVNNISELPFVRYYDAPLPSPGDGVFPMTYMLKFFHQYTVRHVYQDILFVVTNFSILYSPCHALGKNWSPLLPMPTLQLFSYGAIRNGNYCYHLSCWIYFPDFKTTWFIQFVCGKPVASVEFYVKMHGFGTSPFMWVLGSVINILVHHIDNQLVGWNLVVKVFETPKDNAMGPNSDKCKWIGLSNTCLQGVTMLLAVIVEAFGPDQSHDSGIADLLERVSLLIHTPPSLVGATNYGSRTDAGYSESNRKTSCAVIMARLKVCLLLILAVLAMSLTCELKEKPQCVKTLILNVKLEDKLFLKEAGML